MADRGLERGERLVKSRDGEYVGFIMRVCGRGRGEARRGKLSRSE
jgi:hypothetical protein